jgi:hypothetical protein
MNITPSQAGTSVFDFPRHSLLVPRPCFLNRKHNLALNMTLFDHLMGDGGIFQGQYI